MWSNSVCAPEILDVESGGDARRPLVEVVDVRRVDVTGTGVLDFVVDAPVVGARSFTHVLPLQGWVLGVEEPVREVVVVERGCDVRRFALNMERPDVLAAYPHAPTQVCGFKTEIAYLGAERTICYSLFAVFGDGSLVALCEIDVRVGRLGRGDSDGVDRLQPLMLTTLGRSGSTYVMGILSRHPEIVAYKPFEYDVRVARYWVDVFSSLAQPGSYMQSVVPTDIGRPQWWLGQGELPAGAHLPDRGVMDYLGREGVDGLADMCRERVDAFYTHIGGEQCKRKARYFAEKGPPDRNAAVLRSFYPERREIILVRDLRDTICSILAMNRKRSKGDFGRENVRGDEEYMGYLRPSALQLLETVSKESRESGAYLLRYEEFVREPRESLWKALTFLGLDRSDEVLDQMLAPAPAEVVAYHCTSADAGASVGRWRSEFTESMRAAFREHLEDVSLQLGYGATEPAAIP